MYFHRIFIIIIIKIELYTKTFCEQNFLGIVFKILSYCQYIEYRSLSLYHVCLETMQSKVYKVKHYVICKWLKNTFILKQLYLYKNYFLNKNVNAILFIVSLYKIFQQRSKRLAFFCLKKHFFLLTIHHIITIKITFVPLLLQLYNFDFNASIHALKMSSFLKTENNSFWVNFIHFREKTHLVAFKLFFISSRKRVYMYIKYYI